VHEIKHDGYRLIVRRHGKVVRLFTRRGNDWTDRYPAIASAAGKLRAMSFTSTAKLWSLASMASPCSMRSTGDAAPRTPCCTR
jgi:ATP-dependent DNA ligase